MTMKKKKTLVVGLGKSGEAAVRFLVARGKEVFANDIRSEKECAEVQARLAASHVPCVFGHHDPGLLKQVGLVVVSPGVALSLPLFVEAKKQHIPIVGEMELALSLLTTPVIAVSGTNGKTTTTALVGHLLRTAGKRTVVAGNIGTPLTDSFEEATKSEWVVLEVSSFQLESTPSLASAVAILTNITPDHLDRHASFEEYVSLKGRLFTSLRPDGTAVYNASDPFVTKLAKTCGRTTVPFHADMNTFDLSGAQLIGRHNRENMFAALCAARVCGIDDAALLRGLRSFEALPHRLQFVREVGGVRYYNDSKGTNVGAATCAVEGFDAPVVLIAGGLAKGTSFDAFAKHVAPRVKCAVLMGEAASLLEKSFRSLTPTIRVASMKEAVTRAAANAMRGNVVLLSPACASFDMFQNYADRGEKFVEAVMQLQDSGT